MTIAPGGAFITGFFSVVLADLISPSVAFDMMLLLSNGLAAGGFAAEPVIPKESMDPIRFCRAFSAMVPAGALVCVCPRRPSEVRLFMVKAGAAPFVPLATGAAAGGAGLADAAGGGAKGSAGA